MDVPESSLVAERIVQALGSELPHTGALAPDSAYLGNWCLGSLASCLALDSIGATTPSTTLDTYNLLVHDVLKIDDSPMTNHYACCYPTTLSQNYSRLQNGHPMTEVVILGLPLRKLLRDCAVLTANRG